MPSSATVPVLVAVITGASSAPLIVIVTSLGRGAVTGGEGMRVGQALTDIQGLHRGMRIVERIGPGAADQLKVAEAVVAQGTGLVREVDRVVVGIDVRDRQRAVGGQRAVFGDRTGASSR